MTEMTNAFASAAKTEATYTVTENGAAAYNTTQNACLDFYSVAGALREADDARITRLFQAAYDEDPLTAVKTVFYARDVRGGLGERRTFRIIIRYMAEHMPEDLRPNLKYIGDYGRWDDVYALAGTPVEDDAWKIVKNQLNADVKAMTENKPASLLAKWLKTADASSRKTRKAGIYTANKLGMSVYDYKRTIKSLRKYLRVVERDMSSGGWGNIQYEAVPSRAMMMHTKAFERHDNNRFSGYLEDVASGKDTIKASTLYPYDIVEKFIFNGSNNIYTFYMNHEVNVDSNLETVLNEQWKALPNYVEDGHNVLVIADVSGSMYGRPLATSIGLAVYFAERNTGPFHNLAMEFSDDSNYIVLKGDTLREKIDNLSAENWGQSTNLEGALRHVLDTAVENHLSQENLPEALVVVSDMEINSCTNGGFLYDTLKQEYADAGYTLPTIVFWNVNSRYDTYHINKDYTGVQLVSGQSASAFKTVLNCISMTPVEAMMTVINSERYAPITVSSRSYDA